jgi:4-hydroxybenzoate polyprenyltransferase
MPELAIVGGRLRAYARLTRLDKPIGSTLLLWPTLDALWLAAEDFPGWKLVLIFCIGTLLTRSAGCAINDFADRDFDGHVRRTAGRPLPSGQVSPREALAVAVVLALAAAATLPLLDPAVTPYAFVAVAVSASYPYFKRFFPLPQAYLGIAFSFGIPMAYAATRGQVPAAGWLFFLANFLWVMAYDTEYAMVDRADDIRVGIRSSAILFGRADVAVVAACYFGYLAAMAAIGRALGLGLVFAAGWVGALGCVLVHLAWIRGRDPAQCFRAFRHNNWLGLSLFAGIAGDYFFATVAFAH